LAAAGVELAKVRNLLWMKELVMHFTVAERAGTELDRFSERFNRLACGYIYTTTCTTGLVYLVNALFGTNALRRFLYTGYGRCRTRADVCPLAAIGGQGKVLCKPDT
jgi:hypothetical protein